MAITTVSHPPQHAGDAQVKPKSAFGETRRTPWWKRGKNEPQTTTVEHSPFPQPDAPTQVIPDLPHRPAPAPAAVPAALHRDPSTSPDIVAVRMIRVCSQALDEHWTATRLHEALGIHNEELEKRWLRELDGARKVQARRAASEAQAARLAGVFEAAVLVEETTGTHVPLDPQALGRGLAQMTANAHAPAEETMTFPRITDEMPDPRVAAPSPVHTGRDQSAPPLPDAAGDTGAHEPLPHRTDSFEARLDDHGALLGGEEIDAEQVPEKLGKGALWLTHRGRWHQIVTAEHAEDEQVRIHMVGGLTDCPHFTARVHVLTDAQAQELRGQGVAR